MDWPRPNWRPDVVEDLETTVERMSEYTDQKRAFVVFQFGTVVFSDSAFARIDSDYVTTLKAVVQQTPDFNVISMNDGNLLVRFAGPVSGLVLAEFYGAHENEIRAGVVTGGLLPGEQLVAPSESNVPEEHYYAGLYARAKMFRDVESCEIAKRYVPLAR